VSALLYIFTQIVSQR